MNPGLDEWRSSLHPVFIVSPARDESGAIVDLVYDFINDAALALYGMAREDVLGHGLLELFPSSRDNGIYDADFQAFEAQDRVDLVVPWVDENGVRGAFEMQATPHEDGVLVKAVDVTAMLLAERDREYQLLAQGVGTVVFTHGMEGVTEWVSPSVTDVLGWAREDFLALPHRNLVHPDDIRILGQVQEAVSKGGEVSTRAEVRFATVDGGWRWMSVVTRGMFDDQGRLTGAVQAIQDVQAEVDAREALEAQAERLELVLEGAGLGMWDRDMQTGIGVCDERWAGILGYTLAELPPVDTKLWLELTHPDDRDQIVAASVEHAAGRRDSFDVEARMRHKGGAWVWIRGRARIVEWTVDGAPLRMTGTIEDTTAQVEARLALERSEGELRETQRRARLGTWSLDVESGRVAWSDELFELMELDSAVEPPRFGEQEPLFEPDSWELLRAAIARISTTGEPYDLEVERRDSADSTCRWLHVRGEAVRDAAGVIVSLLGYVLDITKRKEVDQALASSEALFRTAMLSSPIGFAMIGLDGSFRVVNESLCRLLGRDEAWLVGHEERDVTHPDDREKVHRERLRAAARGDAAVRDDVAGLSVDNDMRVFRYLHADGRVLWIKQAAELVVGGSGHPDYLLVQYTDTTAEHDALEKLAYQAFHDPLTGLRNRAWIMDILEEDLCSDPTVGGRVGVLFIDLDNFKIVNDSLGHAAGDEVLMTVADRIASVLRPKDRVGRSGGDEFIVVVTDFGDAHEAELVADRIVAVVGTELIIRGHRIVPTVSIGIALNVPGSTSSSLLRDADAALFRAKAAGRSRWQFFDTNMHAHALARLTIEDEIRKGLEAAEFVVHYQPIVRLVDRTIAGYEALVRWQHPSRGLVPPIGFLPTAEDSGLIAGIGQQVLEQVCSLLASRPDLPGAISVNFSPVQLARAGWLEAFTDTLARHGVEPSRIVVEVTETAVMSLLAGTRTDLEALRTLGVGIHVDDFGTGFSSISLLRDMPVTGIKLDASFVADLSADDDAASALSSGLAGLVNGLHLAGIAEGVETQAQHEILLSQGWTLAQGYVYARPAAEPILVIPDFTE